MHAQARMSTAAINIIKQYLESETQQEEDKNLKMIIEHLNKVLMQINSSNEPNCP